MTDRQRVVVVTGGGGGIGAAIAESVARTGAFVVTVDPLVSVDGSEQLPQPLEDTETTAGRIVAAGGAARASGVSVTDEAGVRRLADEFDGLDAVVNVAGISRPTGFSKGSDEDWRGVLSVHLDGYRNVLSAALPLMAAARRGHILGVTSGSGWRAADTGAYGCAKRAVASLTWQLGRHAPDGVVINAISPIAATRMVAAALGRTQRTGGSATGGRLIEVVRSDAVPSLAQLQEAATRIALAPAEANQVSGGGSNARFGSTFNEPPAESLPVAAVRSCAVVADRPEVLAALSGALQARGVACQAIEDPASLAGLEALDAVVVALAGRPASTNAASDWERMLDEHDAIVDQIQADARWSRAVADLATTNGRPIRLVTITDATTAGGRSLAQAMVQLARSGRQATGDLVTPFVVSAESDKIPAELAAHLVCSPEAVGLTGAELVSGAGWFGLRSHPRPVGSISFGGPEVPWWFDDTLREVVTPR